MHVIPHHKHAVNIGQTERILSAVGGGILAGIGLKNRSATGAVLLLAGGDLMWRGITGHSYAYEAFGFRTAPKGQGAATTSVPYELGIRVDEAITIGKPREEVFRFFRDLSNFPEFMKHVESVREMPDGRSHWCARGPAGTTVEWDAVIHNQVENEMIAWRSLEGARVDSAGAVWFKDAPGGRGTEVKVELQYNPPAGVLGAAVAWLWGEEPGQQIGEDLHRLKQIMETGEIPTTEGQPSGRSARQAHADKKTAEHGVQTASEASFPASDAPAYNP
ncbi:MAG TPA: SRPBCC family protein [Bryobacteraceae bacterium]